MDKEFLADRRRGLEEAFFAEQDAALRRRLRDADEAKARREALSAASGITDAAVLDKIAGLGLGGETLAALSVVPLVAVAWADGEMDARERDAVVSGAERSGLAEGSAAHRLLEGWLTQRPPPELLSAWTDYVAALSPTLGADARDALKAGVLGRARAVAEAAGGFYGLGPRVSEAERAVLSKLEGAFGR